MNGSYVRFEELEISSARKTKIWIVKNAKSDFEIGRIRWMNSWRRYIFEPATNCVFDADCLMDIMGFLQMHTVDHANTVRELKLVESLSFPK